MKDMVPAADEGVTTAVSVTLAPKVAVVIAVAGVACSPTVSVFVKGSGATVKAAEVATLLEV